ncbi:MAG: DNA polymerase Y family protein [Thermoanaerobaculum sp.]
MRVASLWVPDFPLAALLRAFPELRERPLAVAAGPSPRDPILAASPEARALGIGPGMTSAQARQVDGRVEVRTVPGEVLAAASAALVDVAASFSPHLRRLQPGLVWLRVDGLGGHFPGEEALASELWRRCLRVGLPARVGVANAGGVATVAARTGEVKVVPAGAEKAFLAPLPLALGEPSARCRRALEQWGIRTFGDLAGLPRGEVAARLGEEGVALHRLACGEGESFVPDLLQEKLREGVWLPEPVDSLEGCLFVLNGVLARVKERLSLRGEGLARVRVELALEGGGKREYTLPLLAPTGEVPAVLALARLVLGSSPPGEAVEGVAVEAEGGVVRSLQGSLFGPPQPHPGVLAAALVRLSAIVGPQRVGQAQLVPTHRPSAWRLVPFAGIPEPREEVPMRGEKPPILRLWEPPRPAQVTVVGSKPVVVRVNGSGGVVVAWAGPYRWQGEWWSEAAFSRDDYDVATADGVVWRVFYDRFQKRWYADGVYD